MQLARFSGSYEVFQWMSPKKRHFLKICIIVKNSDLGVDDVGSRLFGVNFDFLDGN